MKLKLGIILIICLTGCTSISYDSTKIDGTKVHYGSVGWFQNAQLKGLNVDYKTKTAETGLKIQSSDTQTQTEALESVISAAVAGAVKGIK